MVGRFVMHGTRRFLLQVPSAAGTGGVLVSAAGRRVDDDVLHELAARAGLQRGKDGVPGCRHAAGRTDPDPSPSPVDELPSGPFRRTTHDRRSGQQRLERRPLSAGQIPSPRHR
jgi:hypothetical protein